MKDFEIRRALLHYVRTLHSHEEDTRFLEELAICGGISIADVAVVNGSLHCYEIKSQHDTLSRLAGQRESYDRAFDFVTVVASELHINRIVADELVPKWWGLMIAQVVDGQVALSQLRGEASNPETQKLAITQFLWRDEVIEILDAIGLARGNRSKKKSLLWQTLADALSPAELSLIVRQTLKARKNWKVDGLRGQCGDLPRPFSML